ncbi:MAG: 30S ribosome-binding factor RbfA [Oscillospiraceae bacterium]|jgi:ribosome-binding factor A|nr:30S ribosome-binding factor RbfA [Oscillospiraceae bacterium]
MPSTNNNKLGRTNADIERVLSSLLRGIKDPRVNQGMISVTAADTTGDLKFCRVYLSVLGLTDEKKFMQGLKSASGYLRHELGQSLNLRAVPELVFRLDRSIEYGAHINSLIAGLEITPEEDNANDETSDD